LHNLERSYTMTYPEDYTWSDDLFARISQDGLDALPDAIRILVNAAMVVERQVHLGVRPYERSAERQDQANGFKPKTVQTRIGEITFAVPQVRHGDFYPAALEKGLRSERALKLALAEMYVQGVSTRKVSAIVEQLCGTHVTSTQVSRATAELDTVLAAWRTRPLGEVVFLLVDARYEKVRVDGHVRDVAVLWATGITRTGQRSVLGVSVSLSEAEVHWREFLSSLVARGLRGVRLIVSDAHEGLAAARRAVFGGVPWQRCQFHLQQNAASYVPREELKAEVAADIRAIFTAPDKAEAIRRLEGAVSKYAKLASKLASWLEQNIPEGLTVFGLPEGQRRLLRTTNGLERVNKELKRRTRVVGIFPNEASCLRLVSAILMETSEEWEAGRAYLTFD
jgi:transposase-like protein